MLRLVIGFSKESQISVTILQRLIVERVKHNIGDALQHGNTMQIQMLCLGHNNTRMVRESGL